MRVWWDGSRRFLELMGRMNSARGEHAQAVQDVFAEVHARFFPAFQRALPDLSPAELIWRLHFLVGAMCTLLADPHRFRVASEGLCDPDDPDEALRQLVAFGAAGLRAPTASERATERSA